MRRTITVVVLFLALQFLTSVLCLGVKVAHGFLTGSGISVQQLMVGTAGLQIIVTLLSSLLTIGLFWYLRYVQQEDFRVSGIPVGVFVASVPMMLTVALPLAVVAEFIGLPDNLQGLLGAIMYRPLGVLAVGIVGPVCEEVVFRAGIMGGLLKSGRSPWVAIGVSALLFGIIHFNPVQVFCAGVMGVLLGWVYWRTGSLLPCILMHVANNLLSVLEFRLYGADSTMVDRMGGSAAALALAVVLLLLACGIGWYLNKSFNLIKKTK